MSRVASPEAKSSMGSKLWLALALGIAIGAGGFYRQDLDNFPCSR